MDKTRLITNDASVGSEPAHASMESWLRYLQRLARKGRTDGVFFESDRRVSRLDKVLRACRENPLLAHD